MARTAMTEAQIEERRLGMSKVHMRGKDRRPLCRCHLRWSCSVITTIANWAKVTCHRCLALKPH